MRQQNHLNRTFMGIAETIAKKASVAKKSWFGSVLGGAVEKRKETISSLVHQAPLSKTFAVALQREATFNIRIDMRWLV
jgi:hypothetical protein